MTPSDDLLYGKERLDGLPAGSVVYLSEYLSPSDELWRAGAPALSGGGSWSAASSKALSGHHVILLADQDSNFGRLQQQARGIRRFAASCKVTPGCPPADPEGEVSSLDQFIKHRGVPELLKWALEVPGVEPHKPSSNGKTPADLLSGIFSAAELQHMEIPEPNWVVRGLLPEGLCLVAGRPKIGKSWLALQAALAVASPEGRVLGRVVAEPGAVLYVALEDYKGRLKGRVAKLQEEQAWPERLYFQTASPNARGPLGVQMIEAWCQRMKDQGKPARLVVVDTLERFREAPAQGRSVYHEDLEALMPLQALAQRWHLVILVIDHRRKAEAEDIFDTVSGSAAKTGTADTGWIVERNRVQRVGKLTVTGRDIEELEMALEFDPTRCIWTLLSGDPAQHFAPPLQRQIIAAMQPVGKPYSPAEIMLATALTRDRLKFQLQRMEKAGLISRWSRGQWVVGDADDLLEDPGAQPPTTTTLSTPPNQPPPSTVTPHTTQATHTPHADGETGGVGEGGEYGWGGVEVCPECGHLWPSSNSNECSDCHYRGSPVKPAADPPP
ncbi:MAG: AAA family ATPase [Candidatus Dormibacteria bacterium]